LIIRLQHKGSVRTSDECYACDWQMIVRFAEPWNSHLKYGLQIFVKTSIRFATTYECDRYCAVAYSLLKKTFATDRTYIRHESWSPMQKEEWISDGSQIGAVA